MAETSKKRVEVDLGERSYPIHIEDSWDATAIKGILKGRSFFVISDENVAPLYMESLTQTLGQPIGTSIVAAGEASKSMAVAEKVMGDMIRCGALRKTVVVALGGGVVGDLAGFVASTFMRGVPFIQVPTTLLSMVDSSVGGKVAVNHELGKNLIGHFYQPEAVFIALSTLKSLDQREISAGMAEVIKYGIIWDVEFFNWLEKNSEALMNLKSAQVLHAIEKSVHIKAEIVSQDETETTGLRALLNLGHTFAHAEEMLAGYGKVLHGEAVAAGMVAACRVSEEQKKMEKKDVERVKALLQKCQLPLSLQMFKGKEGDFWEAMAGDKKAERGEVKFVIPEELGRCAFPAPLEREFVESVLNS